MVVFWPLCYAAWRHGPDRYARQTVRAFRLQLGDILRERAPRILVPFLTTRRRRGVIRSVNGVNKQRRHSLYLPV